MNKAEMMSIIEDLQRRVQQLEGNSVVLDNALYSIQEVGDLLGVGKSAVYKMIDRGELPTIKLGKTKVRGHDINMIISGQL